MVLPKAVLLKALPLQVLAQVLAPQVLASQVLASQVRPVNTRALLLVRVTRDWPGRMLPGPMGRVRAARGA